jgi:hypothetical protein
MANTIKGEVGVEVDGKKWTLRADMNALCDFEDAAGIKALDFVAIVEGEGNPSMKLMRSFVLSCIQQCHPEATERDAGRVMSVESGVVQRAFEAAFPASEDDENDDDAVAPSGGVAPGETSAVPG